jgi:hypothetical protein
MAGVANRGEASAGGRFSITVMSPPLLAYCFCNL